MSDVWLRIIKKQLSKCIQKHPAVPTYTYVRIRVSNNGIPLKKLILLYVRKFFQLLETDFVLIRLYWRTFYFFKNKLRVQRTIIVIVRTIFVSRQTSKYNLFITFVVDVTIFISPFLAYFNYHVKLSVHMANIYANICPIKQN